MYFAAMSLRQRIKSDFVIMINVYICESIKLRSFFLMMPCREALLSEQRNVKVCINK